jgi:hypothetical protein
MDHSNVAWQSQNIPETPLVVAARTAPPHWAGQRLAAWDENAFQAASPFVIEKVWSGQFSINVFEVVGTAHPDYQGWSWREFLENGKRMRGNLVLQDQNPGYYLDDAAKQPTMYYIAMDGAGWHVNGDGNHRTCIARFMFHELGRTMLHGVHAESYRTDARTRAVFEALRNLTLERGWPLRVDVFRKTISREDAAGWMRESYQVSIRITDVESGTDELLSPAEAESRLENLKRSSRGLIGMARRILGEKPWR